MAQWLRICLLRMSSESTTLASKECGAVVQSLSRVQLLATPWTTSTPAFPVLYLPEFAQTHVCRVGDAIQPSYPLLSPSPPALNLSQQQGLFQCKKWGSQVMLGRAK